jgi:hypothetical protein
VVCLHLAGDGFVQREIRDVRLTDQFGTLRERTSKPQLLCAPAVETAP